MGKGLLSVEFDIREIDKTFDGMSKSYQTAAVNTVNKVGRLSNRNAANHIKQNYNVKASDLKIGNGETVRLQRADRRKSIVSFIIRVIQKRRGLLKYGAKQAKKGLRVKVKNRTALIRGGFISMWRSGEKEKFAFLRDPKMGTYRKGKSLRTKRRALFGPSIANLYGSKKVSAIIRDTLNSNFQKTLDEEFGKQFEKKR